MKTFLSVSLFFVLFLALLQFAVRQVSAEEAPVTNPTTLKVSEKPVGKGTYNPQKTVDGSEL